MSQKKTNEENIKLILKSWKQINIEKYEVFNCEYAYTERVKTND